MAEGKRGKEVPVTPAMARANRTMLKGNLSTKADIKAKATNKLGPRPTGKKAK